MGHLWRSSFSSSPPAGCGAQPLRGGKGGKELDGQGGGGVTGKEVAAVCAVNRARSQEGLSALR